jgi:hypothetical protein
MIPVPHNVRFIESSPAFVFAADGRQPPCRHRHEPPFAAVQASAVPLLPEWPKASLAADELIGDE